MWEDVQGNCNMNIEMDILDGLTEASLLGIMRHAAGSLTALWMYATAAMHSASIEGTPKTGPQICSSSIFFFFRVGFTLQT